MSIEDAIKSRLRPKHWAELTLVNVRDVLTGLDATQKNNLLTAIQGRDSKIVGSIIMDAVQQYVETQVTTEAQSILADNTIDAAEIQRLFG